METYFEIGEKCPHKNCKGVLETMLDGGCSCHINPPCSYCVDKGNHLSCSICGEDPYEFEERDYEVVKYWDNIFDGIVKSNLTKMEAEKLRARYGRTIYTTYGIRKMLPVKKTFMEWLNYLKI